MTGEAANDACEARDDALNARCATWLAAIADDDEQALTALYDATLNRTYAIAIQILRDPMLAEDVVAEVYHDVWQHAARFDATRGQPIPWLLTICRNRALDAYRREASASRKVEAAGDEPNDNMVAAPEDLLSVVESGRAVHEALTLITSEDRQLIALAFFRGMSHGEIAAVTAMPLGTVKSRIRRALKTMGDSMQAPVGA